jgi:ABC-type cobalamin/Fe3+-siderophores transport system ATPase subunit
MLITEVDGQAEQLRMLILGQGGTGKSTLIRAIKLSNIMINLISWRNVPPRELQRLILERTPYIHGLA